MGKSFAFELFEYMKIRKKWWLLPLIISLILVAILVIIAQSTAVSSFIYAMF